MAIALGRRRRDQADDGPYNYADHRTPVIRRATGAAAGAAGSGLSLVARVVRAITWGVVAIIVAAILLKAFEANPSNDTVSAVTDWARWLAGPFRGLFSFDNAKTGVAVNWGLAAVVYVIVGLFIARLFARGAVAGFRARDRRAAF